MQALNIQDLSDEGSGESKRLITLFIDSNALKMRFKSSVMHNEARYIKQ